MSSVSPRLPDALPLPQGLLAWTRAQGPDMWHEIACGIDFADPQATIDLLMAAQWITRQTTCCRATALLLLARMLAADLHLVGPPHLAPEAARVLTRELHRRLAEGRFAEARFRLTPAQSALIEALFGPDSRLPLPDAVRQTGTSPSRASHVFLGWYPVAVPAGFGRTLSRVA